MKNYKDMTTEEIKEQLEWSDSHEFSYGYSMWAFKEIERLNNIIEKLEQENAVLKTQVVNKDKYSYGIRMGSDKE